MSDRPAERDEAPRVFISYRRDDTSAHAGRLYDALTDRFGEDRIFMDVDTIPVGTDFTEVLEEAINRCDVVIALLGRSWLTATDKKGRRRLDNPDDLVRLELEVALRRQARILPVLVQDAEMPAADELPTSLSPLVRRHAYEIADRRWRSDLAQLISVLQGAAGQKQAERQEISPRKAEGPDDASTTRGQDLGADTRPVSEAPGRPAARHETTQKAEEEPRPVVPIARTDVDTGVTAEVSPSWKQRLSEVRRWRLGVASLAGLVLAGAVTVSLLRHGSTAFPNSSEAQLLTHIPSWRLCGRDDVKLADNLKNGPTARVFCGPEGPLGNIYEIVYASFETKEDTSKGYDSVVKAEGIRPNSGDCSGGKFPGEGTYSRDGRVVGRVACFTSGPVGGPYLVWFDSDLRIGGNIYTSDLNASELADKWKQAGPSA